MGTYFSQPLDGLKCELNTVEREESKSPVGGNTDAEEFTIVGNTGVANFFSLVALYFFGLAIDNWLGIFALLRVNDCFFAV
jgi:hypothetical protein